MERFNCVVFGALLGMCFLIILLDVTETTPKHVLQKLCAQAEWKLPSCRAAIEKATKEMKGI